MSDIEELVDEIDRGRCVAFVGAGFSAPTVPTWRELLAEVGALLAAGRALEPTVAEQLARLADHGAKVNLDALAQQLSDAGRDDFGRALQTVLTEREVHERSHNRRQLLSEIPFAAVLTTNFDTILPGRVPTNNDYRAVLRDEGRRWYDVSADRFSALKLHGDIQDPTTVVLRKRDYRRMLYKDPHRLSFLRALLATRTVLYLGFSFHDAYLNELRSEVLAVMGDDEERELSPVAYAIVPDADESTVRYYRSHEGMVLLPYDSRDDHAGFDVRLAEIHQRTSPRYKLGEVIRDRRILWVDAHPQNNAAEIRQLEETARAVGGDCRFDPVETVEQALAVLRDGPRDLVITQWGYREGHEPTASRLLHAMRGANLSAPVIVYASGDHAADNRREALRLGAFEYTSERSALFREIEQVLREVRVG